MKNEINIKEFIQTKPEYLVCSTVLCSGTPVWVNYYKGHESVGTLELVRPILLCDQCYKKLKGGETDE